YSPRPVSPFWRDAGSTLGVLCVRLASFGPFRLQTSDFRLQTLNSTRRCEGFVEDGFEEAGGREWPFTNVGWIHLAARGAGGPARRGAGSVALPRSCPL